MYRLVLIRHGESLWNRDNRFTGWADIDLSDTGMEQARQAGRRLRESGYRFDIAFTSLLKRAIRTLHIVLDELDLLWIPVEKSWRLNERHYGALQGLDKAETARRFGEAQVKLWRRAYDIRPPALPEGDPQSPGIDPRYANLKKEELPLSESLHDTEARLLPYWRETIGPAVRSARRVLIVAHGNSLRALVKHLSGINEKNIVELEMPTGTPLVYRLDADLRVVQCSFLTIEAGAVTSSRPDPPGCSPA